MKINPNITEEIAKLGNDLTGKAKELTSKSEIGNNFRSEIPKGLNGKYFHADLLKDTTFDVDKAIKEFKDINDTETISKICACWREEYSKLLEEFSPENIAKMEDVKASHQKAIDRINKKYEKFTNKISEIHDSKEAEEKVIEVFNTYIEPITQLSMETYSKIDRMSATLNAYKKSAIIERITGKLSECEVIEDLQNIIFEVEKLKEISPKDYEKFSKIIEKRIEELLKQTASNNGTETTTKEIETNISHKNPAKKSSNTELIDIKDKISKMTAEEVKKGTKVGEIYDLLDEIRRSGNEAYIGLRNAFDQKLNDMSDRVA